MIPGKLSIKMAALLVAADGVVENEDLIDMAEWFGVEGSLPLRRNGSGSGSRAANAVYRAMRPIRNAGLAVREGNTWKAANLVELAAWLADLAKNWAELDRSRAQQSRDEES